MDSGKFADNINDLVDLAYSTKSSADNSSILFRDEHVCQNPIRDMKCVLGFGKSLDTIYRVHYGNIIEMLSSKSLTDAESALLTSLKDPDFYGLSLFLIEAHQGEYYSFAKFCPFCGTS